jgi:hypothetical protein
MRCTCYRIDPPSLLAALAEPELLARYQQALGDELPSLADRALVRYLRKLTTLASRALAEGFDRVAEDDRIAADALLTDLFAVATYRGWPLPIEPLGERDLPVEALPRGMLGADAATDGAKLWLIDDETLALARDREADEVADMGGSPLGSG